MSRRAPDPPDTAALVAGDSAGNFVAFDAAQGVPLRRAGLHASITNGPITYELDGLQYVVVAANDTLYAFAGGLPLARPSR